MLSVLDSKRTTVLAPYLRKIDIPNKFGIVDDMAMMGSYKGCFEQIGSYWVSKPISEPAFLNQLVWVTHNNYLFRSFTLSIGRIHESGLFGRWERFISADSEKLKRDEVRNLALGAMKIKRSLLEEHSVSKHIFLEIIHFGGFIAICLVTFCAEHSY